jgi:hypothetical protein
MASAWIYQIGSSWYTGWRDHSGKRYGKSYGSGIYGQYLAVLAARKIKGDLRTGINEPFVPDRDDEIDLSPCPKVYFIEAIGLQRVKIGMTDNIKYRFDSLQSASPVPLKIMAVISGDRTLETYLHKRFKAHRLHGEWFILTDEMKEIIQELRPLSKEVRHMSKNICRSVLN